MAVWDPVRQKPARIAWDSHQENPSCRVLLLHGCNAAPAEDRHKVSEEAKVGEEEREMKRSKLSSKCYLVIRKFH